MNDNMNEIGEVADTLMNLTAMLGVPGIPARIHIESLRELLPEAAEKLKKAVIAEIGENPWEGQPE